MTSMLGKTRVTVSFYSLAVFAVFLLLDKSGTTEMFFSAVICHELGHLAYLAATGARVTGMTVGLAAFGMTARPGARTSRVLLDLSGCAVNLLLAAVFACCFHSARAIRFSAVNAALCAVNLLPVQGTDGGELCACLLVKALGSGRGERAAAVLSSAVVLLGLAAVVWTVIDRGLYLWGIVAVGAVAARLISGQVD